MFTQFQKNRKYALVFIVALSFAVFSQQIRETGDLVGTISFGDEKTYKFIKVSPNTKITLIFKGKKKEFVSSSEGDYLPSLPVGQYCIFSVRDEFGNKLKLWQRQHRCFKIRKGKTTRFDISLLE